MQKLRADEVMPITTVTPTTTIHGPLSSYHLLAVQKKKEIPPQYGYIPEEEDDVEIPYYHGQEEEEEEEDEEYIDILEEGLDKCMPTLYIAGLPSNFENEPENWKGKFEMEFTCSDYRHVQLLFENVRLPTGEMGNTTYSVDKNPTGMKVMEQRGKTFSREDWSLIQLPCKETEEYEYKRKVYKTLIYCKKKAKAECPYNLKGEYRSKFYPRSGNEKEFFCSEFVMWCLIRGGFLEEGVYVPEEMTPGTIMNIGRYILRGIDTGKILYDFRGITPKVKY